MKFKKEKYAIKHDIGNVVFTMRDNYVNQLVSHVFIYLIKVNRNRTLSNCIIAAKDVYKNIK